MQKRTKQLLSIIMSLFLVLAPALNAAGIEVDGTTATTLDNAQNGVKVVNIANPNTQGLSHNKYTNYNVSKEGLILNNSMDTTVKTQLGGYIFGNSHLTSNAKVILNEVTSTQRTNLNGYTEVAGKRADLVVANPNGITLNGAGFINTSAVTLTTGTPSILNGVISSYNVQGGEIAVEGEGLDATQASSAYLYAKVLTLNAKIYANDLNVKFASLDSSALGGMYANAITLAGTDKGVGVTLPPEVLASNGDISISNDGTIELQKVTASNINVTSNNDIGVNNNVYASDSTNLQAFNNIKVNSGTITAKNSIDIKSKTLTNDAIVFAGINEDLSKNSSGALNIETNNMINNSQLASTNTVQIQASEMTNNGMIQSAGDLEVSTNDLINNSTIFSGRDANMHIANNLSNLNGANIFAMRDILIDGDEAGTVKTKVVNNNLANIQSINGDISIYANQLNNTGEATLAYEIWYKDVLNGNTSIDYADLMRLNVAYNTVGWYENDYYGAITEWKSHIASIMRSQLPQVDSGVYNNKQYFDFLAIQKFYVSNAIMNFAKIQSNNNINLVIDNGVNKDGYIYAGKDLNLDVKETLKVTATNENVNGSGYKYIVQAAGRTWSCDCDWKNSCDTCWAFNTNRRYIEQADDITVYADSLVSAGGNIVQTSGSLEVDGSTDASVVSELNAVDDTFTKTASVINYQLPVNNNGLFVLSQDPSSDYLIETNPQFISENSFLGSKYLMDRLGYDVEKEVKILGDGLYEQRLIQDQILSRTGKSFLNPKYTTNQDIYQNLMDNAYFAQQDLELSVGISLSKEQIDSLTKDIVWIEERQIKGKKVLVPVLYLANKQNYKLAGGSIIAGDNVALQLDRLSNSGNLQADSNIIVQSDTITNKNDIKANEAVQLVAKNDINNLSGSIQGKSTYIESLEGDVSNETLAKDVKYKAGMYNVSETRLAKTAAIKSTNGNTIVKAKGDVSNVGSEIKANNANVIVATSNGDLNFQAIKTDKSANAVFDGGFSKSQQIDYKTSQVEGNNVVLASANDVNLEAANVRATDNLTVDAKKNVNITALKTLNYTDAQYSNSTSGLIKTKTITRSIERNEGVAASTLSGANVNINAGNDVNLESVNINAKNTVEMKSEKGNVNLFAKSYTNTQYHESTSSSLGGLVGSHSIDAISQTKLGNSATIAKNSIRVGGKNINIIANDLEAKNGTIKLQADENINIASGKESSSEQHVRESTGLSLGIDGGKFTYAEVTKDSNTNTNITNKATNISANNIILESRGDANIIASNVNANTMEVNVANNFNIVSDQDVNINNQEHSKKELGVELKLTSKEASLFTGYWENGNGKTTTQKDVAKSTLNTGTLNVQAKNANIVGSDVVANDVQIDSQNTKVLSVTASTDTQSYTKSIKAGVSVGVTQNITDTIDKMKNIGESQSATGVASRTLKAYDAVNSFLQKPVDAGVYAIYNESKTSTNEHSEQAVASNIYALNNATLHSDKNLEVGGSNIHANNNLNLEAKNINLHATAQNYSSATTSNSKNAKASLYGSDMGTLTLGFQDSSNNIEGTTQANTHITAGNKATLTSTQDTTLKGAVVDANELAVNAGRNLVMQSMQDTQTIRGESKGGSVSGNVLTMTPTGASANYGTSKGDKKWVNEATSLNGKNTIVVSVNDTTTLKGASITNKDANSKDQGNLQLTTNKLKTEDLHDYDNFKSTNVGIGIGSVDSNPSLNSVDFANNTKNKEQIVRATVGQGSITTNSDTTSLNRDITKTKQITKDDSSNIELYASDTSLKALSDPTKAYDSMKQKAKDVGLAVHKEIQDIPSASKAQDGKGDFLDATLGVALDKVAFLGVLPSQLNDGGYVTQISIQLFGDNRTGIVAKDKETLLRAGVPKKDIQAVVLVKTKDGVKKAEDLKPNDLALDKVTVYRTDPDKKVVIGDPKNKTGNPAFESYKIRISEEDVKNSGINHLFTNGMFNSTETATYNQQTQQGFADGMLNYNQQHGILGDLLESAQDAIAVNTGISVLGTGGARQTGEVIRQMADATKGNLTSGAHSQGTLMTQVGMDANKEYLKKLVKNNKESKFLVQYSGSPVNHKIAEELVSDIYGGEEALESRTENGVTDVFRSQVAPEDFVGSVLGWQSAGINNSEDLGINIGQSILSGPRLFGVGGDSTHSYYPCIIGCGNDNVTPKKDFYLKPKASKDEPLTQYYKKNFTDDRGNTNINMDLLPQGSKDKNGHQSIINLTGDKQ